MVKHMPAHTRRAHAKGAEWHGDNLNSLDEAKDDGFDDVDQNVQWVYDHPALYKTRPEGEARIMHWGDPKRNNYRYYLEPGAKHARKMTKKELRRKVGGGKRRWSDAQVARWRRGPSPSSAHPHTLQEHFERARKIGIDLIPELKSRAFGRTVPAEHVVAAAEAARVEPWFMTLWYMLGVKAKVTAIVKAGGQIAIIFGKRKALRAVARRVTKTWAVKPTRIW